MSHYFVFDAFDNPMHLSKVGNWVITFLSPKEELEHIQLAITYVLPRHLSEQLQPRRVIIHNTAQADHWLIQEIECYNSQNMQEVTLESKDPVAQQALQQIIQEFSKYDVNVSLI
jgi:hypothetical protein